MYAVAGRRRASAKQVADEIVATVGSGEAAIVVVQRYSGPNNLYMERQTITMLLAHRAHYTFCSDVINPDHRGARVGIIGSRASTNGQNVHHAEGNRIGDRHSRKAAHSHARGSWRPTARKPPGGRPAFRG
jgi:hypothetical protein